MKLLWQRLLQTQGRAVLHMGNTVHSVSLFSFCTEYVMLYLYVYLILCKTQP